MSVLASCPHQVALTGGQFRPTPGTAHPNATASKPAPSSAGRAEAAAGHPLRRQLLQSSTKALGGRPQAEDRAGPAEGEGQARAAATTPAAGSSEFRSPAPRSVPGKQPGSGAAAMSPFAAAAAQAWEAPGPAAGPAEQAQREPSVGPAPAERQQQQQQQLCITEQPGGADGMEVDGSWEGALLCGTSSAPEEQAGPAAESALPLLPTPRVSMPPGLQPPPAGLLGQGVVPVAAPAAASAMLRQEDGTLFAHGSEAAGPEQGEGSQRPSLEVVGLQMATPAQEPLPHPPALAVLQPLPAAGAPAGEPAEAQQQQGPCPDQQRAGALLAVAALLDVPTTAAEGGEPGAEALASLAHPGPHPFLTPAGAQPLRQVNSNRAVGSSRPPRHPGRASPADQLTSPPGQSGGAAAQHGMQGERLECSRLSQIAEAAALVAAAAAAAGGAAFGLLGVLPVWSVLELQHASVQL